MAQQLKMKRKLLQNVFRVINKNVMILLNIKKACFHKKQAFLYKMSLCLHFISVFAPVEGIV